MLCPSYYDEDYVCEGSIKCQFHHQSSQDVISEMDAFEEQSYLNQVLNARNTKCIYGENC